MSLRDWLQVFRIQTAPFFVVLGLVPFLYQLSTINLFILILVVFVYAFAEFETFGHNSVIDVAYGYDQRDMHKQHHPLVAGRIKLSTAHAVVHRFTLLLVIIFMLITIVFAVQPLYALAFMMLGLWAEEMYNDGLNHESLYGWIDEGFSGIGIIGWGWFMSKQTVDPIFFVLCLYAFLTVAFQTAAGGHMKNFAVDTEKHNNILATLGASLDTTGQFHPGYSRIFLLTKVLQTLLILYMIFYVQLDILNILFVSILLLGGYYWAGKLFATHYDQHKVVMAISLEQSFAALVVLFVCTSWVLALTIAILAQGYYFVASKLTWGSFIHRT